MGCEHKGCKRKWRCGRHRRNYRFSFCNPRRSQLVYSSDTMDKGHRLLIDTGRRLCISAWLGERSCHNLSAKYNEDSAKRSVDWPIGLGLCDPAGPLASWKGRVRTLVEKLLDFLSRSDGGSCPNKKKQWYYKEKNMKKLRRQLQTPQYGWD